MRTSLGHYLRLVRIPNVVIAVADVVAGYLYAGGQTRDGLLLAALTLASACLYAGGAALNDVCDAERDLRERPERPIPSGRIARRTALRLAVGLLVLGIALAAGVSIRAGAIALLLVSSIVLYDGVLKSTPAAPGLMGLCRALNLLLGMSLAPALWTTSHLLPLGLMWLYVTSVTIYARTEAGESRRVRLIGATLGAWVAVAGLAGLRFIVVGVHEEYLLLVALLFVLIGYQGLRAVVQRTPDRVQQAVKTFVLSIVLFDACLTWSARGLVAGLSIGALLVPAMLLGRRFRVT